jgi:hypothetical protein
MDQNIQNIYTFPEELLFLNSKPKLFDIRKTKVQKKWTKEEDVLLIELARKFNHKNWKAISSHFTDKTSLQCFSRYKRIRPGIIKGSWSREEDEKIIELVEKYGKSWSKISKVLVSRNGKQIRDRYINILDPNIKKGKFCLDEDLKLLALYRKLGPRWATISKFFENRTADMIKNRFHSSIKKNMKFFEDLELDYSFRTFNKEFSFTNSDSITHRMTRFNSIEDSQNIKMEECYDNLNTSDYKPVNEEECSRKDFEGLKTENPINLNFLQTAETPSTKTPRSPLWQLEDYFII